MTTRCTHVKSTPELAAIAPQNRGTESPLKRFDDKSMEFEVIENLTVGICRGY